MSINVYLVRHGQTYLNKYDRLQGWSDAPLTDSGVADATRAGQELANIHFDAAFSSDLARTVRTAQLILAENSVSISATPTEFFREQFFGSFEGAIGPEVFSWLGGPYGVRTFGEMIEKLTVEKTRDVIAKADPYGDAEDDATFQARMDKGLALLREQPDGANVLVVSHGTTIRSLVSRFGPQFNPTSSPKNGSITKLIIDTDQIHVPFFNELKLPN